MDRSLDSVKERLLSVRDTVREGCRLVAVSKYHPVEMIQACYDVGQRIFGESHEQEIRMKHTVLPKDIEWHFIGHLQTNKIKYMASYVALIHGVDSYKLLVEINKQAIKVNRIIPCLLQIHIAQEETKFGFSTDECRQMLEEENWKSLKNVQIAGVMGMATNTDDESEIKKEFENLSRFFHEIKNTYFPTSSSFKEISMGMSDDYLLAIEEGSTLIRIGSRIFGARNY